MKLTDLARTGNRSRFDLEELKTLNAKLLHKRAYDDVALLGYGYAFEQGGPKLRPVPEV